MPMFLDMEMKTTVNFISSPADTMSVKGVFYLTEKDSYVRFGEFEQVVNDSLALLVSDSLHQMILYTDAKPVINQMKKMMGAGAKDSSVASLAAKYSAVKKEADGLITITLTGRLLIYNTNLPKEAIEMIYHPKTKIPQQVVTIKRTLMPLEQEQYRKMQGETAFIGMLMETEGKYFLIKEYQTSYLYKKLEYTVAAVPVKMEDRIIKIEDGRYKPVKDFETYSLTNN